MGRKAAPKSQSSNPSITAHPTKNTQNIARNTFSGNAWANFTPS